MCFVAQVHAKKYSALIAWIDLHPPITIAGIAMMGPLSIGRS
jgi:hypothetical protein